jgi:hypothetical protein
MTQSTDQMLLALPNLAVSGQEWRGAAPLGRLPGTGASQQQPGISNGSPASAFQMRRIVFPASLVHVPAARQVRGLSWPVQGL